MKYEFYTGSYAQAEETGIYKYELDTERKELKRLQAIKGVARPSYLLLHSNGKVMYSVEELSPKGRIAVFSLKEQPEYLFSVSSEGADPCHLSIDEKNRLLFAANYTSGGLAVYRLDEEGMPVELADYKQHSGSGKNPERQEGPHVHFSGVLDGCLYVCDLGTDTVVCYGIDGETKKLVKTEKNIQLPAGFGPRHFAVHPAHPGYLYVIGELTGEVAVFKKNADAYERVQMINSLPEDFKGENTAAAIRFHQNGKLLLVSNRGSDSITSFLVQEDGLLKKAELVSCGGEDPRDFAVFDKEIVVANQYSDHLSVIELQPETGAMKLTSVHEEISKPVMIQPVNSFENQI